MKKQNDNRMLWIRNIESIKESDHPCFVEHEFASEVYIPGVLNYENEKILCAPLTLEPDQRLISLPYSYSFQPFCQFSF